MTTWSELPEKEKTNRKAAVKRFRANKKAKLIEYKGGQCQRCGYNKPVYAVYEFHHRDPTEKDPNFSKMVTNNWNWEKSISEADKCDLLCANCHREVHTELRNNV